MSNDLPAFPAVSEKVDSMPHSFTKRIAEAARTDDRCRTVSTSRLKLTAQSSSSDDPEGFSGGTGTCVERFASMAVASLAC